MSASLVIDGRCRAVRRRLGPVAWALLEEAALAGSGRAPAAVRCELSVRSVVDAVGVGRAAASRALADLITEGALVPEPAARDAGGRFARTVYRLVLPEGASVFGLPEVGSSMSGPPHDGAPKTGAGPDPGASPPRHEPARSTGPRAAGHPTSPGRSTSRGQTSLFASEPDPGPSDVAPSQSAQLVRPESCGATKQSGGEADHRDHELAPVVPAGAGPGIAPADATAGGRC